MPKTISKTDALDIVKEHLENKFYKKIETLKENIKNIKYDYNHFSDFQEETKCPENIKVSLEKLNLANTYNSINFTKAQKEKLKTNLSLKQYFCKYYFRTRPQRCCFCGQLFEKQTYSNNENYNISTIEHLFPKSKFPQYALCLNNWAPCCNECNRNKGDDFFEINPRKQFYKALQQLGINENFGKGPLQIWKNISFDFSKINGEILIKGKPKTANNIQAFKLLEFYGLNKRYRAIQRSFYNNLFNLIKCHNISTPEAMEAFLESCQTANMQEMISDFSLNNCPKLWGDFLDYVLYDYNNLVALWEEIKEYNKLKYFKV